MRWLHHRDGSAVDPVKYAGVAEGDAHLIRNTSGRAGDAAIRPLVISHTLLGTSAGFVIHHSDCGRELFTNEVMRDVLVPGGIPIHGDIYDVKTGKLQEVADATSAGKPRS
jgi:carbonic anhydrase